MRRFLFALAGLSAVVVPMAALAGDTTPAATTSPDVASITTGDAYTTVTITFTEPAFTDQVTDSEGAVTGASGDLETSDFTFTPDSSGVTLDSVTKGADASIWTLGFSGTLAPNADTIAVKSNEVFAASGEPFPATTLDVPISNQELAAALEGLRDVRLPLHTSSGVASLPMIVEWFVSLDTTDVDGDGETEDLRDRTVAELVQGLSSVTVATQEQLETALETVAGIGDVSFSGGDVVVTFDPGASSATISTSGKAGAEDVDEDASNGSQGIELADAVSLDLGIEGGLTVSPSGTDATVDVSGTDEVAVVLDGTVPLDPEAKLGFVGIGAPASDVTFTGGRIAVDLTCSGGGGACSPADLAGTASISAGSAQLSIPEVTVTDGAGTTSFTDPTDDVLTLSWSDLSDLSTLSVDLALPDLANFGNVDLDRAIASLEFLAAWFVEVDRFSAMGEPLPVIGQSLGELSRNALGFAEAVGGGANEVVKTLTGDTDLDGIPDVDPQDVDAQRLVEELCEAGLFGEGVTCSGLLSPVAITTDTITYDLRLELTRSTGEDPGDVPPISSPALSIGDDLAGLQLAGELSAPISVTTTATFDLTLGLDLRSDATLIGAHGLDPDDFDDDGEPNTTDPDVDGDLRDDAVDGEWQDEDGTVHATAEGDDGADEDTDADGLPETYSRRDGDLCRATAGLVGADAETFAAANAIDTTTEGWKALCDDLIVSGDQISFSGSHDVDGDGSDETAPYTLTDDDVCFVGASLFLVVDPEVSDPPGDLVSTFIDRNSGFSTTGGCATAVSDGTGTFNYDATPSTPGSPVRLGHRAFVDAGDLLTAGLTVDSGTIGARARLGFLDVGLTGSLDASPSATVSLADVGAADGRITLTDLAAAADGGTIADVVGLTFGGPVAVHVDLANPAVLEAGVRSIDVVGDLSALDNTDPTPIFEFHSSALADDSGLTPDRIHVGTDLGDLLNFDAITPAQIRVLIRRLAEQLIALASDEALETEIPFVGVRIHEMVDFADRWGDIAQQVLDRAPQTASALSDALGDALESAGMPRGVNFAIDGTALEIGFDASTSASRTYPFSFDLDGFPIAPADGGASIAATGAITFAPTLGITLADLDPVGSETEFAAMQDALYLRDTDLSLTGDLAGSVFGSVNLGPVSSGISGDLSVAAALTLGLNDADGDERILLDEVASGLSDGTLLTASFSGPFSANLAVSKPEGTLTVSGDLSAPGSTTIEHTLDLSSLTIDLDTLVQGILEVTRFVSRTLETSDELNVEVPLFGDVLAGASDLGSRMETLADQVETAYNSSADGAAFMASIETAMEGALCPGSVAGCDVTVAMVDDSDPPAPSSFADAESITFELDFGFDHTGTESVSEGLSVDGVFDAGLTFDAAVEYGYEAGLTFGVSRTAGFFLEGGEVLSLYAGLAAPEIDADVSIFGVDIAQVVDGSAVIGGLTAGGLGPRESAAGFAVSIPDLSLRGISSRHSDIDGTVTAGLNLDADIDLPLQTTSSAGDVPLPTFHMPVFFDWEVEGLDPGTPSLSIGRSGDQVRVDVTSLIGGCTGTETKPGGGTKHVGCHGLIAPLWVELGELNPLADEDIKGILTDEVPVLDASLLEIADELGVPGVDIAEFLLTLDGSPPTGAGSGAAIEFGWVEVLPTFAFHENTTPWQCQNTDLASTLEAVFANLIELGSCGSTSTVSSSGGGFGGATMLAAPDPEAPSDGGGTLTTSAASVGFETGGCTSGTQLFNVEVPLLDDPTKILSLLLGPELADPVSFIQMCVGSGDVPLNIGPQINYSVTLFDLDIGFLEGSLKAGFAGGLGVQFRIGVGYDSTGLLPGRDFLDGFYVVDFYNSAGKDVQEISAGGFVSGFIDGKFAVLGGVAAAHFKGSAGVNLTAGLDLFDESPAIREVERGDGRFHFHEMGTVMAGHEFPELLEPDYDVLDFFGFEADDVLCIFRPEIDFSAHLSLRAKAKALGVTVFDKSFSDEWTIINESITCALGRVAAQLEDSRIVLNAGPEYGRDRFDGLGDVAESFEIWRGDDADENDDTTRDLDPTGEFIWVEWTGADPGDDFGKRRFRVSEVTRGIYGDLGAHGDSVTVLNDLGVPMTLLGGGGVDHLEGSDADDIIDGGAGNDRVADGGGLFGGGGNDTISGGPGNDDLDGGVGNDLLAGNEGDDRYLVDDGWGRDGIDDALGNDTVDFSAVSADLTGDSFFGDAEITAGTNVLGYFESDIDVLLGGSGADDVTLKSHVPNDFIIDLQGGDDHVLVLATGQDRTITVDDSGATSGDELEMQGTAASDTFLFRGRAGGIDTTNAHLKRDDAATEGFVAMISPTELVDRVDYTDVIDDLVVHGGLGNDVFAFDDNASGDRTTVNGDQGEDVFQVGQIFGTAKTLRESDGSPVDPSTLCRPETPEDLLTFERCIGYRDGAVDVNVAPGDEFAMQDTTRGFLSNGITHPATMNGGEDDDLFQVFSNQAAIDLNGEDGDDTFIVRAFALEGSVSAAVMDSSTADAIGMDLGTGADYVEYAQNAPVTINGGDGFDTVILVGTEFGDGILIAEGSAKICPVEDLAAGTLKLSECAFNDITFSEVESLGVQALEGNDLVLALSTSTDYATEVYGGDHDDTVFVGRDAGSPSSLRGGDLTGVQGPLSLFGEADPTFDATIPTAIALPDEVVGDPEPVSPLSGGTEEGDVLVVDGSDATTDQVGGLDELVDGEDIFGHVTGLGIGTGVTLGESALPGGVVFDGLEYVDVRLGSGADDLTVHRTHDILLDLDDDDSTPPTDAPGRVVTDGMHDATPVKVHFTDDVAPLRIQGADGGDTVNVRTIDVATRVLGQDGDDTVNLGSQMPSKPGVLEGLGAFVDVEGGTGADTLNLDDTAESEDETGNVDLELVTGLGLHELGVRYVEVETLDLDLGTADEVVNVRGTTATTTVHGNDGDERHYVSDVADLDNTSFTDHLLGTLDDIGGDLTLDSGAGRHLLMVSDENAGAGDGAGVLTESSITGLSTGDITYTTGGNWADGVTVWTSQHDDTIDWTGAHLASGVRTITTLNTGNGGDVVTVGLDDGTDGFSVLNVEEGNDEVDGAATTRDLIVFGSEGGDDVTTGSGDDLVLGDLGNVTYQGSTSVLGNGGLEDATDGLIAPIATISHRAGTTGGSDVITTGDGDDVVFGGASGDTIDTGNGADIALGDTGEFDADADQPRHVSTLVGLEMSGNDLIHLGSGDDLALGQHGSDEIHAGQGDDLVTGGHNLPDGLDGSDELHGDGGDDILAGDNAVVAPAIPVRLLDVATTDDPDAAEPLEHGDDLIHGGSGDDAAFGQSGDDEVHGDAGDDYLEGNAGDDRMSGGDGQDDAVGGGSADDGRIVDGRLGDGLLDGADTIDGDGQADVIAGDNARVLRSGATDPANGAELRDVRLFDVATVGGPVISGDVHGPDSVDAGSGDDWAFGQGDDDLVHGGDGIDRIEGNHGIDTVFGGPDGDDITGGGSANDGIIDGDRVGTELLDDSDFLYGDDLAGEGADDTDGHDVILGDNGRIDRLTKLDDTWATIARDDGLSSVERVVRAVTMPDTRGATAVYGSDVIRGNGGDDDLYGQHDDGADTTLSGVGCIDGETLDATSGQFAGDLICGDAGEDAIVADEGFVSSIRAEDRGDTERVATNSPFIDETIHESGTVIREVLLEEIAAGGDDVVFGGDDRDHIHLGAGDDLANGGAGNDAVFGGNGNDDLWGGPGHDRIYGGFGEDSIDVKPRTADPADPASWWVVAPLVDRDGPVTTNGKDTHYGGWDADELQADEGDAGTVPGDRLVDWQGAYNAYYVCDGAYGAGRVEREFSPNMVEVWQRLAHGDGAFEVLTEGASGEVELALVSRQEVNDNTRPTHPNHPGHFTCEGP